MVKVQVIRTGRNQESKDMWAAIVRRLYSEVAGVGSEP